MPQVENFEDDRIKVLTNFEGFRRSAMKTRILCYILAFYDVDRAILYLETARNSHTEYTNGKTAPWQVYPEQDADWVEKYDFTIDVIERLAGR